MLDSSLAWSAMWRHEKWPLTLVIEKRRNRRVRWFVLFWIGDASQFTDRYRLRKEHDLGGRLDYAWLD